MLCHDNSLASVLAHGSEKTVIVMRVCAWQAFDVLEFFSGRANLSRCMKLSGLRAGSLDILYSVDSAKTRGSNPMDLLSDSGFARLTGRMSHDQSLK